MPRLPTAENLGQRPTPSGKGNISRLQLSTPRMGQEAQAEIQFGKAIEGLGDTLFVLGMKAKKDMDATRVEDDFSGYQRDLLELEHGEKEGFSKVLGGDAAKRPLVEEYRTRRESIAKQRRESLENDDQRIAFDKRVQIADRQFDVRIYAHKAEQSRNYEETTFQGVLATEQRAAALNWQTEGQVSMSLLRTDMEIERRARRLGITDKDTIDNQKLIAGTAIHENVIQQMLVTGKDAAATAYYKQVKEELTPDAIVSLGAKVDLASSNGIALRAADTVWGELGPNATGGVPRMDLMGERVRAALGDNPKVMDAVLQDLKARVVEYKDGRQEMDASNEAAVLKMYHDGDDMRTIQSSIEYQALKNPLATRTYIVERGRTEQAWARSEEQYQHGVKAQASWGLHWELSNPTVLSTISESQISALEPVLGRINMESLLKEKRKLSSPESIKAATIDETSFNRAAHLAGLNPYDKSLSPEQKEKLGRLKSEVLGAIDIAQRGGKQMGFTEKEELMQKMIDKKVYFDGWGTSTPSMPAATIHPDQRDQVFTPMKEIEAGGADWLKGAINYIRSVEPGAAQMDDATIKRNMKGRLERGYAISITNGSADEVKTALQGKDKGVRQ